MVDQENQSTPKRSEQSTLCGNNLKCMSTRFELQPLFAIRSKTNVKSSDFFSNTSRRFCSKRKPELAKSATKPSDSKGTFSRRRNANVNANATFCVHVYV